MSRPCENGRTMPAAWRSGTVLAGLLVALVILADGRNGWTHQEPAGCVGSTVGLSLDPPERDGDGDGLPDAPMDPDSTALPLDGETIFYRARLGMGSASACAFEGGTLTIITPDGVHHDVTPASGIPCIGGGPTCPLAEFVSKFVPYVANKLDRSGGVLEAQAVYTNGLSHQGNPDAPGEAASATLPIGLLFCGDGTLTSTKRCSGTKSPCSATVGCPAGESCTDGERCDPAAIPDGCAVPGTCGSVGTAAQCTCLPCGDTAPMCNGPCPAGQVCSTNGTGCGCITPCANATAPTCGGVCPAGQTCASNGTGCGCITPCASATAPACGGVCPVGQTCASNGTGCGCITPCANATAPVCGGVCPAGQTCASDGTKCGCITPCSRATAPVCGGTCPAGQVCSANGTACQCVTPCSSATAPTCGGTCPLGQVCSANGGSCQCITPCDQSSAPTCGGKCPAGQTCSASGTVCQCTSPCASSTAPTCGGTCPPDQVCTSNGSGCQCAPPACGLRNDPCQVSIGGTQYPTLQAAIDAAPTCTTSCTAVPPTIISVRGACAGPVLVYQKANLTIQGVAPGTCPPGPMDLTSTVRGNPNAPATTLSSGDVIKVLDSTNITVQFLNVVDGAINDGLTAEHSKGTQFNCNCVERNEDGMELDNLSGNTRVVQNLITHNEDGLKADGGTKNALVDGNLVVENRRPPSSTRHEGDGIRFNTAGVGNIITNNTVLRNRDDGIDMRSTNGTATAPNRVERNLLMGNGFTDAGAPTPMGNGIEVQSSSSNVFNCNKVSGNADMLTDLVRMLSGAGDIGSNMPPGSACIP